MLIRGHVLEVERLEDVHHEVAAGTVRRQHLDVAGGVGLAAACDISIMADDAHVDSTAFDALTTIEVRAYGGLP